ncbi:hypothetical protein [Flavobacterium columnare]|uniref:hypothetical protein n=1 Tax=Flavobacterium columnare TaxID=996 RepID=UPI000F4F20A0|nr:hypothetical protein [Flavobacterium columnare]
MKTISKVILFIILLGLMLLTTIVELPKLFTNIFYGGMFIFSITILINDNKITKEVFNKKKKKDNS